MLYLIKRGPRPDYHKASYHQVIICDRKARAEWEAGCACNQAWVWTHEVRFEHSGWLLVRWCGLSLNWLGVIHACKLPDGTTMGHGHDRNAEPWTLIEGAVWWSDRVMPGWVAALGAVYPSDNFTQQKILDDLADDQAERDYRKAYRAAAPGAVVMGVSCSGSGREIPAHWPKPVDESLDVPV